MYKKNKEQPQFQVPDLPEGLRWEVVKYSFNGQWRKCPHKFEHFEDGIQFIKRSGDYYHFIGHGEYLLLCSIHLKTND